MAIRYVGSTKWTAVTAWAATTAYSVGDIRRQLATPTAGQERVFRCTTAGTSGGAEPAPWTLTAGSTTNDGTCVWTEITGSETYNQPNNFAAPHYRLLNVFASGWSVAGDTIYISNNHAYTINTTSTYISPGTVASPCILLCIDDNNATATLATGATETTTSTATINITGHTYCYGLSFSAGTG